ncbi:unnamed protein product [Phytophthora lilii]|uniref:Unnamed protein product n=1 Tax=Phytophthora lilii TaxID=2077276 RepID=A0A9W6TGN5_9STRA|nr:unnamed protein product [Phytophthora lilii]
MGSQWCRRCVHPGRTGGDGQTHRAADRVPAVESDVRGRVHGPAGVRMDQGQVRVRERQSVPARRVHGAEYHISQCNNMFIFPGVGLAASIIQATRVMDGMLYSAARALSQCLSAQEIANGQVFASVENIRDVSLKVATAVCETAIEEGVAGFQPELYHGATLENFVASKMYFPSYHALVE